jgi:tRNA pseudouridine32 synthase / 23S rRNA pseudouridine746 synthase
MEITDLVRFIDGEAIVLDKPAGLDVNRPRSGAISVEGLAKDLRFGFGRAPTLVHRLDRDTSGCLLLARNDKAHKRFQIAFESGLVEKLYVAVLEGVPEAESGTIDLPLGKVSSEAEGWRIVPDPKGKSAITHWRTLAVEQGRALVEFRPETGRTHQLRVHAASGLGIPIKGDPHYGHGGPVMLLHAVRITIPRGEKPPVEAEAPLPIAFGALGFAL